MISKDDIIKDIVNIYQQTGVVPDQRYYDKHGKFSTGTVKKIFGKWSLAIFLALNIDVTRNIIKNKNCLHCSKETKNPKFCSRSCAGSYNNKNPTGLIVAKRRKKTKKNVYIAII